MFDLTLEQPARALYYHLLLTATCPEQVYIWEPNHLEMGDLDPPQTVPCFRPSAFKNSFTPYRTFIIVVSVSHLEIPLTVYTNSPDNLRIARHKLGFNLNLSRRTVFTICVRGLDSKREAKQNNTTGFYYFLFRAAVDLSVDSWQTSFSHRVCPDIRDVCV